MRSRRKRQCAFNVRTNRLKKADLYESEQLPQEKALVVVPSDSDEPTTPRVMTADELQLCHVDHKGWRLVNKTQVFMVHEALCDW